MCCSLGKWLLEMTLFHMDRLMYGSPSSAHKEDLVHKGGSRNMSKDRIEDKAKVELQRIS